MVSAHSALAMVSAHECPMVPAHSALWCRPISALWCRPIVPYGVLATFTNFYYIYNFFSYFYHLSLLLQLLLATFTNFYYFYNFY